MHYRPLLILFCASVAAFAGPLPNPALTSGVARDITIEQVCTTRWGRDSRAVTATMKRQVYARYHMAPHSGECALSPRGCEIDHLIPRELGGADDVRNLWPQPYGGLCNAADKDRLENRLHKMVCAGEISLKDAQRAIATDWVATYRTYIGQVKSTKTHGECTKTHGECSTTYGGLIFRDRGKTNTSPPPQYKVRTRRTPAAKDSSCL